LFAADVSLIMKVDYTVRINLIEKVIVYWSSTFSILNRLIVLFGAGPITGLTLIFANINTTEVNTIAINKYAIAFTCL